MEDHSTHVFFIIVFILLQSDCVALDIISANQVIKYGKTIISSGSMFELGFFSPGNSKNQYLGIWYKKISTGTVVWVANRETPVTDNLGMFKVSSNGNLVILSGGNTEVWSSNLTVSEGSNNPVVMQLMDTGNLVVWRMEKSSTNQKMIWQSFDYPGDTFLPGMKLGNDLITGIVRSMTCWKSPDDPSPGLYNHRVDINGYPQVLGWRGPSLISRPGPWNGLGFSGYPTEIPNRIYTFEFVVNEKEIYYKYELVSSVLRRIILTWDGKTQILHWIERTQEWIVYADVEVDSCSRFALCGSYGICSINKHPPCTCLEGFEPRNPEEWDASDWSSGCQRKKPLNCGNGDGDWFRKIAGVKVPDTRRSWYNVSMTLGECEKTCKRNCSCTAYGNLDIRNGGSGCLLWFDEMMDTREYDANDQDIYIRMAASELEGHMDSQPGFNKKKGILMLVLLTSSAMLLLFGVAYACIKKRKRPHMKGTRNWYVFDENNSSLQIEHLDELTVFSLSEVARATCNFSVSNKIGEGGFGPVYKGVLIDGTEIAAKRLSETSQQGLDEFKNEVTCIAKLQHRNLVKLLGYSIYRNELILIYEYMTNKSLDFYLFDETRSLTLDWSQRFNIIHGIARGILYLHQDSRLQIIHRDLKAANILLDSDMNPKISDFGLARRFVGHDTIAKTKKVVGTHGYISPEYAVHGRISIKSDVFSYGVLVLEIVSGMKNREFSHDDHHDNLLGHAWRLYKEGRSIELMSASLHASCIVPEVLRSIHVALLCVQHHAEDRPTMLSVVLMLVSNGSLPEPKQPAFFSEESSYEHDSIQSIDERTITLMFAR
ncbi:putative protein kinase RLK-Pelle-DLSV family [Helianthus annuus]|uniref:Receptor-like serine/threonine-protein kinase n=1 Tax=Helianthus annuus TaxID=4232 RepID=A0A251U3Z3_HELAN|nr:G-type lectin S-receptor-like serine/threonine-protein kinase At4g27290 isoform X1 [Helianthus annuus]KAF5794680.1 putative protein kinase RLK-Pelle-DLSV family [Helianthus annuus]KAJ0552914.1 putative protein kinase RLK-Pelle-DLSV family [Helianthus annuus]KAJ0718594.1 putative protein kinase RLK-Pelle-DLSV family [Helianthus annuus]KAJ0721834.1 putative protein kinase RLK-Pelle-DLSV family [Helianthus annuus]KAJ0897116.1 putative protein kinase RLK-Pelle-DLSV family [Helianthus annuus]